ncbi:MAG TPA: L-2-hydroxyglutarate oxidase [Acidimicrobiales bacterium]|nr:L-2-hydroxyglutarate oxidase [Acidimicrobiales bacterium]
MWGAPAAGPRATSRSSGGGILGLATARELTARRPGRRVTILEKEDRPAQHQTGRNSGVVHAGIYYAPGSLKARLCTEGRGLLRDFCEHHGVKYDECGKLVVALDESERAGLHAIHARALANEVPGIELVDGPGLRAIEPHVAGIEAVWSPATAIVDFPGVCDALLTEIEACGGELRCGVEVVGIAERAGAVEVVVDHGDHRSTVRSGAVVICAGLQSDRLARLAGGSTDPRIVPFRGEYYALAPQQRHLVNGLVYPVPDPRYPFLGIHLTRHIDGEVLVGPNAVLALAREGYRGRDVVGRDLWATLSYRGFWALARENWRNGASEMHRSLSRTAFVREAQRYVPALEASGVVPARAGVRAQAVAPDGSLVDDFVIEQSGRVLAVRNAPSPGATSSLTIARHVEALVPTPDAKGVHAIDAKTSSVLGGQGFAAEPSTVRRTPGDSADA